MEAVPAAETVSNPIFANIVATVFDFGFLAFAVLYLVFTLIVLRQVNLMTSTIKTEGGGAIKAAAILYCGLSLGIIVLMIGLF